MNEPVMPQIVASGRTRRYFRVTEILATILLLLCIAINYQFVLTFRVNIGTTPVSLLDLTFIGILTGALWRSMFTGYSGVPLPRAVGVLLSVLLLLALLGAINGLFAGFALYDVAQDFRVMLYFLASFWVFSRVLHPRMSQVLPRLLVLAGFAVAVQVLFVFVKEYLRLGEAKSSRDVFIPAQVLPFAVLFISSKSPWSRIDLPRFLRLGGLVAFVSAIVLSLTRIVWLEFLIAVMLLFAFDQGTRRRFILTLIAICALSVLIVGLFSASGPVQDVTEELGKRLGSFAEFAQGEEYGTFYARMEEITEGSNEFVRHPVFGAGLGAAVFHYNPADEIVEGGTSLHDSIVFYGVKLGTVGLAAMLSFWILSLRQALTVPRSSVLFGDSRLLVASTIGFMIAGNFSGNLNYIPFVIFLGALLGTCVTLKSLSQREAAKALSLKSKALAI